MEVSAGRSGDPVYSGMAGGRLLVIVESAAPPRVLTTAAASAVLLNEGSQYAFDVALATPPSADVFMTLQHVWLSGLPRDLVIEPRQLVFRGGESMAWQTVTVKAPHGRSYLSNSTAVVTQAIESEDVFYDAGSPLGARTVDLRVVVSDADEVGICLSSCMASTEFELLFRGDEQAPVETPYEIIGGKVSPPLPCLSIDCPGIESDLRHTAKGEASEASASRLSAATGLHPFPPQDYPPGSR